LAGASTLIGGPFAPALAGAIVGGGNSFVSQGFAGGNGKSWSWSNIDYKQVGISSLTGAITGYVAGQMSDKISPYISKYVSALTASPVLQDMVTNAAVQSTTGFTINTGWSLANGDSWDEALNKGWDGFKNGLVVGGATGAFSGFQRVNAEGVDWWSGKTIYPSNNGFEGQPVSTELQQGQIIDRYGNNERGQFFAPEGTPIENRSLPPNANTNSYNAYEVLKPFPVQSGITAPFYGQPGGGIQYYSPNMNVLQLTKQGYIRLIIK